ncbi:MAG: hypothetical protein OXG64_00480 [Chloroflexi bacterium]|nr:hypothetical protein [Chloroflexota bacterium]
MEASFRNITPSPSFTSCATAEVVAHLSSVIEDWLLSTAVRDAATEYGVATERHFDSMERALKQWISHPSACGAIASGECLGYRP